MPCIDQSPKVWIHVRDRSVLELRLRSDQDAFTTHITLTTNGGDPGAVVETWEKAEVMDAGKRKILTSPDRYDLSVLVTFLSPDPVNVEVESRILRPGGGPGGGETLHGAPFCERLTGRLGDVKESILAAVTRRAT